MVLKRTHKIIYPVLLIVISLLGCKKNSYAPNDGMVILQYMNHKTDSISYAKDSILFLQWKNTLQLKPGDTAIIEIDGIKD